MKKVTKLELDFYKRIYKGGSWYRPDVARDLQADAQEVLIADCPDDEELSGLRIAVYEDRWIPDSGTAAEPTGLHQVHIMGDKKSLRLLRKYLLAISETELPEDRVDHFEPVKGAAHKDQVHLVVHHSFREDFGETVRVGPVVEIEDS